MTTIQIGDGVKERIRRHGQMGDTYDTALTKILNRLEELEEQELRNSNKDPRRAPVAA